MPHFTKRNLEQQCTYWEASGWSAGGERTVESPVTLNCRWEFVRKEITNAKGEIITIDAMVVVDQDIEMGSAMALGSYDSWLGTGSLGDDSEVMEVVSFEKVPNVKGRKILREVGLAKYADTPPELT